LSNVTRTQTSIYEYNIYSCKNRANY